MFYGIIKSISERGFGFIEHEGGRDVYFHATDIGDEVFRKLQVGQPVTFEFAKARAGRETEREEGTAGCVDEIDRAVAGGRVAEESASAGTAAPSEGAAAEGDMEAAD